MKAAVLHAPGPPSALRIEETPVPSYEPGEVLVRVAACGVSSRDVVERNGTYRRDVTYPLILGLEISGTVVACGSAVGGLQVGDHVCSKAFSSCGSCRLCRNGRETTCFRRRPVRGGYAEYVALPADALVQVPGHVSFEVSCGLGPAAGVALNAVRDVARVSLGEWVLVAGASGGVGWTTMQLAHLAGARVIALTRQADKRDPLLDGGADEVVIIPPDRNFADAVRRLTGGWGVDVVIDNVGSRVFDSCFSSLAVHGRYAFVGQLFDDNISVNPARIFFKRAQLLGVGSVSRSQLEDIVKLVADGRISPKVARVLPLEEIVRAHQLVESGRQIGRIVVTPESSAPEGVGAP